IHTFHGYEGYPLDPATIKRRQWIAGQVSAVVQAGHFIEKWYGTKPDIVTYGGVDAPDINTRITPDTDAVFVGRLEPDTGIKMYLEALLALKQQGRMVSFRVCGDGSLRTQLEDYARQHQLSVEFVGMVDDVQSYIARVRIVVV